MMDAAFEFSTNGLKMNLAIHLIADGQVIPHRLFIDILTEKCQLIHNHIKASKDCLMIVANVSNTIANIKLYDRDLDDSQLLSCTISNHPDLEEQLYRLWVEVRGILRDYAIDDHNTEMHHIDAFYSWLDYEDMMHANLV